MLLAIIEIVNTTSRSMKAIVSAEHEKWKDIAKIPITLLMNFVILLKVVYGTYSYLKMHPSRKLLRYLYIHILSVGIVCVHLTLHLSLYKSTDFEYSLNIIITSITIAIYLHEVQVVYSFWRERQKEEKILNRKLREEPNAIDPQSQGIQRHELADIKIEGIQNDKKEEYSWDSFHKEVAESSINSKKLSSIQEKSEISSQSEHNQ